MHVVEVVGTRYSIITFGLKVLVMAIRVVEFSNGGTKLERFLPKNQHTQRKLLNFENWANGEVSKVPKFDQNLTIKVNFLLSESFSYFFH